MNEYLQPIKSPRYPNNVYNLYAYEIDPTPTGEDKEFVYRTRDGEANELATRLNPYDTAGNMRPWEVRLKDAYLGVLAENLIVEYLQNQYSQEARVVKERFVDHETHVDIKIHWNNGSKMTIEVRSSFAYSSMSRVVYNIFDHLGPYTTSHKRTETLKDVYLRGILHEGEIEDSFSYDQEHILYFAGGASGYRFKPENGGKRKTLKKDGAEYWTIPLRNGMDVPEIIKEMRRASSAV